MQFIKVDKYEWAGEYSNQTVIYYKMSDIYQIVALTPDSPKAYSEGMRSRITISGGKIVYSTLTPEVLIQHLNTTVMAHYTYIP